jgi:ribose 5-phosphate isomerase B
VKVVVASDHAGFPLKARVIAELGKLGHETADLGTDSTDPVDYNKLEGVRAATCHDPFSAHQAVEDDDVNVMCLGGR